VDFETLRYETADAIATLTLNRPERHNAFNLVMAEELARAWQAIKADPEVVCVILTGAGPKAFCTGMDLADVASGDAAETGRVAREDAPWFKLTAIQNKCWKPVITAVNGMVVGGGLHFIADSDLILCSDTASFFDTHVKVGLVAGLEPVGLTRRIPLESVLRMALLGGSERMSAEQALALGLVGEVVPAERLMDRARELALKIAKHSPTALALTKRVIWEGLETGLDAAIDNAWNQIETHADHPDLEEGAKAFVEKRAPRWKPYTS